MDKVEIAIERIFEAVIAKVPSIVLAVIMLVAGTYFIRLILGIVRRRFERRNVDLSLRDFLSSIIKFILYTMLIISVASMVGIQTTSFIAVLGAMSLSIGLALQGSLSNFAGGVLILLFKPFRVGDSIQSASGAAGVVEKIDILYTTMRTADGIAVFAPNGPLANAVITNFSSITRRRLGYQFRISYQSNIKDARDLILKVLAEDYRIMNTPKPEVRVLELTDVAMVLQVNAWTAKEHYLEAYHDNFEAIKLVLDQAGFEVPPMENRPK